MRSVIMLLVKTIFIASLLVLISDHIGLTHIVEKLFWTPKPSLEQQYKTNSIVDGVVVKTVYKDRIKYKTIYKDRIKLKSIIYKPKTIYYACNIFSNKCKYFYSGSKLAALVIKAHKLGIESNYTFGKSNI